MAERGSRVGGGDLPPRVRACGIGTRESAPNSCKGRLTSALFAFVVMAVVITGYYAWRFSIVGPVEPSFWLVAALWGSFAVAYIYNRVRM